jgi:glutamate-1-semialdehyde 2,1-aminomutase
MIEAHHHDLAAVIMEPFQRLIVPQPGFLQGVREITARLGVPLVFDEIVTGLRFAYGGAQQYYGVVPDLAAFGKIVGGGFPLAAVAGRRDIMRHFSHELDGSGEFVQQAGTLSGNPIAAAAGLATLAELRKPGAYERLFATGRRLKQGLETAARRAGLPAQVTVGAISCRLPPDRVGRGPPLMAERRRLSLDAAVAALPAVGRGRVVRAPRRGHPGAGR